MNVSAQNLPTPADRKLAVKDRLQALSVRLRGTATAREDQEFLPAHLEILDTPPAPLAVLFTWVICAMFAATLAWSWFAKLDIHAVASGRVQLSGRSKVVQPLDPGRVKSLLVANGAQVKHGDVLVELDPTEAGADLEARKAEHESLEAEVARRMAVIPAIRANQSDAQLVFPPSVGPAIQDRERAVLAAEIGQYLATRESLLAQRAEKFALQKRFETSILARERLHAVLQERANMRETLVAKASGTRAAVIDALQQVEQTSADLAYDRGALIEARAAAESLGRRLEQLSRETIAQQSQKLSDALQKYDISRQALIKAVLKHDRTKLRAPIDGTVQQLAVTTNGQVVTTGQPLMVVVPTDGTVEIEALVVNKDVGFVTVGQEAVIKIEAFPFTRYGTIEGRVVRVSREAVDDRDVTGQVDSTAVVRSQSGAAPAGTPRTQNLVFPVTIELNQRSIKADGKDVPLTPGMMTTVEIRTGDRRVIDYLLAPIKEVTSTAGHER